MKKLSLKGNALYKGEVLTRAQLKKVMGGDAGSGSGSGISPDITKIDACKGKILNNACMWRTSGVEYWGRCLQFQTSPMACSSLI
jgi:hypothetical protein